ncbi:MAG TPA: sigma-54 dependent transcriptional regulator [bacterium]|nr:sigma-54 dependent transcriptional regulator [bacterium]
MKKPWKILIVDDDPSIRRSFEKFLRSEGYAVVTARDGIEGWEAVTAEHPDVVLMDINMPRMNGLELLEKMRGTLGDAMPLCITITAYGDLAAAVKATQLGSYDFLTKPIPLEKLRLTLQRSFEKIRMSETVAFLVGAAGPLEEEIVGRSPAMVEIYKQIAGLATNKAMVLISGESGCGKEVVARAIHRTMTGGAAPWIAVNCAALPENLIESELMGHVKGSFTGAEKASEGKLGMVGDGTLLLDEITEIPPVLQAKLLRLLQEREYFPVGAVTPRAFTGRIIAVTNRDLEAEVRAGRFREDLYYRLNVVHLRIPPLREHLEDIDLLVPHFVRKTNFQMHTRIEGVTREGIAVLKEYPWPGNIRELENLIVKAAIASKDRILTRDTLDAELRGMTGGGAPCPDGILPPAGELVPLKEIERRYIDLVYRASHYHKGNTASTLGITRPTLDKKLEEYGITKDV